VALYLIPNGPMQTTAGFVKVTTAAVIKTMLQVKPGPTKPLKIKELGIVFDGAAAGTPILVEFIETDVAATVTAHVSSGIRKLDAAALAGGDPVTDLVEVGVAATGYTATAEGAITATRDLFAPQLISPTNQFIVQIPLGEEPIIQIAKFGRIRVTAPLAVNAICWYKVEA
jgi:hypothetical protein